MDIPKALSSVKGDKHIRLALSISQPAFTTYYDSGLLSPSTVFISIPLKAIPASTATFSETDLNEAVEKQYALMCEGF